MRWYLFIIILSFRTLYTLDWNHPTLDDLKTLQEIYINGCDEIVPYFDTYDQQGNRVLNHRPSRYRNYRFYSDELQEVPSFKLEHLGQGNPKKQCVLLYCGTNGPYKHCIRLIINALEKLGYEGDVLYQIGGWPYLQEDSLRAFRTPYGFKPCACMEAMKRGYDFVLWLDTVLIPVGNMDQIFNEIEKNDIMIYNDCLSFFNPFNLYKILHFSEYLTDYLKVSPKKMLTITHLNTAVIGLNFLREKTRNLVNQWFEMAKDGIPFLYASVDQLPFSYLTKKLNLQALVLSIDTRPDRFVNHSFYSNMR